MSGGKIRWQIRHSGGRLRLPVHDEQVPSLASAQLGIRADAIGRQLSAGLRDVPQVVKIQLFEPDTVEQIEGVRHTREGGGAVGARKVPQSSICDRRVGQNQGGTAQEVAVDDRKPIAVVHG